MPRWNRRQARLRSDFRAGAGPMDVWTHRVREMVPQADALGTGVSQVAVAVGVILMLRSPWSMLPIQASPRLFHVVWIYPCGRSVSVQRRRGRVFRLNSPTGPFGAPAHADILGGYKGRRNTSPEKRKEP